MRGVKWSKADIGEHLKQMNEHMDRQDQEEKVIFYL